MEKTEFINRILREMDYHILGKWSGTSRNMVNEFKLPLKPMQAGSLINQCADDLLDRGYLVERFRAEHNGVPGSKMIRITRTAHKPVDVTCPYCGRVVFHAVNPTSE